MVNAANFSARRLRRLAGCSGRINLNNLVTPGFTVNTILVVRFTTGTTGCFPSIRVVRLRRRGGLSTPDNATVGATRLVCTIENSRPRNRPRRGRLVRNTEKTSCRNVGVRDIHLPNLITRRRIRFNDTKRNLVVHRSSCSHSSFVGNITLSYEGMVRVSHLVCKLRGFL